MKWIANILRLIWRLWFIIVAGLPIIIMGPVIYFIIAFDRQKTFTWFKHIWGAWVLFWMGFRVKTTQLTEIDKHKSYIIIGNHTSVMDIMVLLKLIKLPFVFVGKEELAKLPIFGYLYKKSNVMVNRNSPKSRKEVYDQVQNFVRKGNSIAIYPEGGVPDPEILLAPFKNGAFRMAIEHQLPILPLIYFDNKKRFPYNIFKGGPGILRVKILPLITTEGLTLNDLNDLKDYTYTLMYNELMNDKIGKSFDA
jgi:1-acyl-sn-glycerol-3-phosphate acyltransferase